MLLRIEIYLARNHFFTLMYLVCESVVSADFYAFGLDTCIMILMDVLSVIAEFLCDD